MAGVEQYGKRQSGLAAVPVASFELGNLVFSPSVETVALNPEPTHLVGRIILAHAEIESQAHQPLEAIKQVVRRSRPLIHRAEDRRDVLSLQRGDALLAVLLAEPLQDAAIRRLRT